MSLAGLYLRIALALLGAGVLALFLRLLGRHVRRRRPSSLVLDLSPFIPAGVLRRRPPGN